jgi:hypothetical protein
MPARRRTVEFQKCFIQHAALHAIIAKVAAYFSGTSAAQEAEQDLSAVRTTAKTALRSAEDAHNKMMELDNNEASSARPRQHTLPVADAQPQQQPPRSQAASEMMNLPAAAKPTKGRSNSPPEA